MHNWAEPDSMDGYLKVIHFAGSPEIITTPWKHHTAVVRKTTSALIKPNPTVRPIIINIQGIDAAYEDSNILQASAIFEKIALVSV